VHRHRTNLTALLTGVLFAAIGGTELAVGEEHFGDALEWVWPIALLTLGVALLLRSGGEHGSGDEVGAEGSEDREVEQAGRSHDG
jgi:hypothetical protein